MNINFGYTDGAANALHGIREKMFEMAAFEMEAVIIPTTDRRSGKIGIEWVRFTGFPIGQVSALATIFFRTIAVVEPLFKGFANILGAPFSERCEALRGMKQLFVDLPVNVAKLILLMPIEVAGDFLATPLAMLVSPEYAMTRTAFEHKMIVRLPEPSYWERPGNGPNDFQKENDAYPSEQIQHGADDFGLIESSAVPAEHFSQAY